MAAVGLVAVSARASAQADPRCPVVEPCKIRLAPGDATTPVPHWVPDELQPVEEERPPKPPSTGWDTRLGFVSMAPFVGDKTFSGTGTLLGTGRKQTFSGSGRDLGYLHPRTYGGEAQVAFVLGWVRIGAVVGYSTVRPDEETRISPITDAAAGSSMSMIHAGLVGGVMFPIDRVRIGLGAVMGAQFLNVWLRGLEADDCSNRGHTCTTPRVWTAIPMVQPRLTYDIGLTDPTAPGAIRIGGMLGIDLANHAGICWGVTFSIDVDSSRLARRPREVKTEHTLPSAFRPL
jgi:hypothetical protein